MRGGHVEQPEQPREQAFYIGILEQKSPRGAAKGKAIQKGGIDCTVDDLGCDEPFSLRVRDHRARQAQMSHQIPHMKLRSSRRLGIR